MAGVLLGFAAAAALPFVLFGNVLGAVLHNPKWSDFGYLSGLTPWVLLGAGLLFMLPVVATKGVSPESRFYPRARGAYIGWGTVLYLLGFLLAWQVQQMQGAGIQPA